MVMKKVHLVGLATIAVLAFSMIAVATASAAEILIGGEAVLAKTSFEIGKVGGEILLEDMGAIGTPDLLCLGIFDGSIEAGGKLGFIEEVLMSNGELLELGGNDMVDCKEMKNPWQ